MIVAAIASAGSGRGAGRAGTTTGASFHHLGGAAVVRPSTPEQFTEALKADEANVSELLKMGVLKPE